METVYFAFSIVVTLVFHILGSFNDADVYPAICFDASLLL